MKKWVVRGCWWARSSWGAAWASLGVEGNGQSGRDSVSEVVVVSHSEVRSIDRTSIEVRSTPFRENGPDLARKNQKKQAWRTQTWRVIQTMPGVRQPASEIAQLINELR